MVMWNCFIPSTPFTKQFLILHCWSLVREKVFNVNYIQKLALNAVQKPSQTFSSRKNWCPSTIHPGSFHRYVQFRVCFQPESTHIPHSKRGGLHFALFYAIENGHSHAFCQFYLLNPIVHSQFYTSEQSKALCLDHKRIWHRNFLWLVQTRISNLSNETFKSAIAFPNHKGNLLILIVVSELCSGLSLDIKTVSNRPSLEP